MALRLGDGVERLPGIGPARARSLEKLGLATVEDLLRYFPRDYEDRRRFSTVAAAPVDTPVCLESWWRSHPTSPASARGWSW